MKIDTPSCLDISVKETETEIYISIFNSLYNETGVSAAPVKIRLTDVGALSDEATVFPSGKVSARKSKSGVTITASALPEFAVVTIKK